jgi:hypothetical protein
VGGSCSASPDSESSAVAFDVSLFADTHNTGSSCAFWSYYFAFGRGGSDTSEANDGNDQQNQNSSVHL